MTASFHTYKAGLKHFGIELNLYQDYAANKTDQTLYGLVGSSTLFAVVLKGDASNGTKQYLHHDQHAVVGRLQPDIGKSGRYPEDAGEIRARLRVHSGPKLKASLQLWRWGLAFGDESQKGPRLNIDAAKGPARGDGQAFH